VDQGTCDDKNRGIKHTLKYVTIFRTIKTCVFYLPDKGDLISSDDLSIQNWSNKRQRVTQKSERSRHLETLFVDTFFVGPLYLR
jgi:hypothetical protein